MQPTAHQMESLLRALHDAIGGAEPPTSSLRNASLSAEALLGEATTAPPTLGLPLPTLPQPLPGAEGVGEPMPSSPSPSSEE
jgi:hypothetical protein